MRLSPGSLGIPASELLSGSSVEGITMAVAAMAELQRVGVDKRARAEGPHV